MLSYVKSLLEGLSKVFNIIASACLAASTLLVIASSVMRYIIGKPFHFTEELCALLFMALSSFSVAYVLTLKKHIRITFVFDRIPYPLRSYVEIATGFVTIVFIGVLIKETFNYSYTTLRLGGVSKDAELFLFPWMVMIPIGLFVFELITIVETVEKIQIYFTRKTRE